MKYYGSNVYPTIDLHDCCFKIAYENGDLQLIFDDGFHKGTDEDKCEEVKGLIQISDFSIDEMNISFCKGKRRFGNH